jgi:hypothetical protein
MCTGRPVSGAEISLEPWRGDPKPEGNSAKTDEEGRFRIAQIQNGSFYVHAGADGYARRLADHFFSEGAGYKEATIYLAPARTLQGKTLDVDGKPVAGVNVEVAALMGMDGKCYPRPRKDAPAVATSDENGWFQIPGLPQGYAQLITFGDWQCEVQFRTFPTFDHLAGSRGNEIRLTVLHTGEIRGHVVVPEGVTLPQNAEVRCFRLNDRIELLLSGCSINADRTYSQTNLLPGDYLVGVVEPGKWEELWKSDRPNRDDLLKATEQKPGTKRVTLKPGGAVDIEVTYNP